MNTISATIRFSRDEDVAAIAAIYQRSVEVDTASWEVEPPGIEEMMKRWQALQDAGFPHFVAEVAGVVVGYSYASSYRARIGYRFVVEDSVYVHEAHRGKGIAKALLSRLIEECRMRGYKQIIAVIGDSENIGSIRLHESVGFQHVGTFKKIGYKFERWLDSVQMQRAL
jgi:L-amino acid N-acyltransferase YncA